MKTLICSILIMTLISPYIIFDFTESSQLQNWRITNDVVMGGKSNSKFILDENGNGQFTGNVSLENNGGFCLLSYYFDPIQVKSFTKISIRLKGDSKNYQFRLKEKSNQYYSYVYSFKTNGDWEEIEIPLKEMKPMFRGRKVDKSNFSEIDFEEIGFLIGNKKNESFKLLIDKIELK